MLTILFSPAEGDGPLPMSKNLRDKLRELCAYEKQGKLPKTIPIEKKKTLARWCRKLENADSASGMPEGSSLLGVVAMGVGFFLWARQQQAQSGSPAASGTPVFKPMSNEDLIAARAARMKRFAKAE